MADKLVTTAVCFLALLVSCSARPNSPLSRRDDSNNEESLPNETPEELIDDVHDHRKQEGYNEDELEDLDRRQLGNGGPLGQTPGVLANSFQVAQSNPQQLQELKDILSLEMNNKDKFAEIYSQMTPDQVKKIREMVLKIGEQTNSEELIKFGLCKSPRFDENGVKVLIGLGEALYDRLNVGTGLPTNRISSLVNQADQTETFNQMKSSISNQQEFIRRLVNMIEQQLSRAPQIDDAEFVELKQITEQIKSLSAQVQTQLQESTDVSQLTKMGQELLQIQDLSSKLQQKVSAELLEEKMKDYVNSVNSNANQATADSGNSVNLEVRDTLQAGEQLPQERPKPKFVTDMERFVKGIQSFFENFQRDQKIRQQNKRPFNNNMNRPPPISDEVPIELHTKESGNTDIQFIEQNPQETGTLQKDQPLQETVDVDKISQLTAEETNTLPNTQQNLAENESLNTETNTLGDQLTAEDKTINNANVST